MFSSPTQMKLKLISKKEETGGIWSFYFAKPDKFNYKPGQNVYLTLPKLNYPDKRGATRQFTLSSSPTEEFLTITTIIRPESGFKKTLLETPIGTELEADGPQGEFFLDRETDTPQVFLAGGIGITPFYSMIKFQIDNHYQTPLTLIYSAKTTDRLVFKKDFDAWAKNDFFSWKGLTERIDKTFLSKYDLTTSEVWVCGPPGMVVDLEKMVKPLAKRVYSEKFTGY